MEIKNIQEAKNIKRKLMAKYDEKSKELLEIKKGLLKVDSIMKQLRFLEKPYLVEIQKTDENDLGITIDIELFEDYDSAVDFINSFVENPKEDLDIYLHQVTLDTENVMEKSFKLLRYDKVSIDNVSPNFIFYNLGKLSKNKFELDSQDFIPISLASKVESNDDWEITNLSEILTFLFELTEKYDSVMKNKELKAITQDSKLIKSKANVDKVFSNLNNDSCNFNLIQNTSTRQFELNQLYNADNLDDVVAIHYFFKF